VASATTTLLVNIDVAALEPAIRFYEQALGLRLERKLFGGSVAELSGAGVGLYLLEKPAGTDATCGAGRLRDYRRHWTPVHLDVVVNDIVAAVERATSAGASQDRPIEQYAWGRLAAMSDPFGNGFCFVEWSGAGYAGQ
jgi:predicted enzyme related to lactoylglutathione lyase